MGKVLCILGCLAVAGAACAEVEVRIWVTNEPPQASLGGPITFSSGYGPLTPYTTKTNDSGSYDVHRNHVGAANPGSVATPKLTPDGIPDVVEPTDILGRTPLYLWGAFCGPGDLEPIKPGLGWERPGVRIRGLHLKLVTTGSLVLEPHWYQYERGSSSTTVDELRWHETSDMSGNDVTLVGIGMGSPEATGWYAGSVTERMQTWALDSVWGGTDAYGAGGILLGAIRYGGWGNLYVGLGYNGIEALDPQTGDRAHVTYYPGTEDVGIPADTIPNGSPTRIGQTPEAVLGIPEPAGLLALSLGLLTARRRRPRA